MLRPSPTPLPVSARVADIEDFPAAKVRRLTLAACPGEALPAYQAGQYALLTFAGHDPRPYSIGNAPGRPVMEFHIRSTGGGASAYATAQLEMGNKVDIAAPFGNCIYIAGCNRPILAVAGGSGLAGMKAVIEAALDDKGRSAPVSLYYGARLRNDLYLDHQMQALADKDPRFSFHPVLSEEDLPGIRHGLVTGAVLEDHDDLAEFSIYAAGPAGMLRHLEEEFLAHRAALTRLHTDLHHHSRNLS